MLREVTVHADWCEMTMSMMREKQFEACERRLFSHPGVGLFSDEATQRDAQALFTNSFDDVHGASRSVLITLDGLRQTVLDRLPTEALYISNGEIQLLEKLLMNDGELLLGDWDDIAAAEALVSRLWCSFHADGNDWTLRLPKALHQPLLEVMNTPESSTIRDRLFRYDATIHGLLYIAGLLHAAQPMTFFLKEVVMDFDEYSILIARRYLQSAFDYVTDANGDLILLHPGLADPFRLISQQTSDGIFTLELSQDMIAGGMNGILPEETPIHNIMCGALQGALRPECDVSEAAEDLRMLAKQGVSLREMQNVMASMLAVMPTDMMNHALEGLYQCTPHWMGLNATLVH